MDETLVYFGGAVKALGDGRVGGHVVTFGSPDATDLENDFFTKDTYYGLDDGKGNTPVIYHHGLDGTLKKRELGRADLKFDDVGVWAESQLNMRDAYEQKVYELTEQGKLGWSTGAPSHMVERKAVNGANEITHWLIAECSLTPTPADFRQTAVALKSLPVTDLLTARADDARIDEHEPEAAEPETPEASQEAVAKTVEGAGTVGAVEIKHATITTEERTMPEEIKAVEEPVEETPANDNGDGRIAGLEAKMDAGFAKFNDMMAQVMQYMEDSPNVKASGYFSVDGGRADPQVKSFGDFLLSVKRGDHTRLTAIYKTLTGDSGSGGGYLVPEEYNTALLESVVENSQVIQRVKRQPVASDAGAFPSLDLTVTPTAGSGQTAKASGVKATGRKQAAALTETDPSFAELNYRVRNIGGYTQVANEVIADSPIAIEALLVDMFEVAVRNQVERDIIRGSGSGSELLGILNADCAIGVTPDTDNTFAYKDMLEMLARFMPRKGSPVFLVSQTMFEDIGTWEIGSNGAGVPQGVGTPQQLMVMPGTTYPMIISEHMPIADASGCVILADLGSYILFERQGLQIGYSEHVGFLNNKASWRFTYRADGMPWLKNTIKLANPGTAHTVSPFVFFND